MARKRLWKSLHFRDGRIVSARDKSPWVIGEWREVPAPVRECVGLNCCKNIYNAFCYVNVEVLAEVEIDGTIIHGNDKTTAQRMRIIRAWKWKKADTISTIVYTSKKLVKLLEEYPRLVANLEEVISTSERWLQDPTEENLRAVDKALLGGYWYYGADAGAFGLSLDLAASGVLRSVGARLAFDFKMRVHRMIVKRTRSMVEITTEVQ
jgi:hypothetical protein